MDSLAVTSITNFLLAGEVLFLAGMAVRAPKTRYSAAWYFAAMLLLLGLASLAGGIDHGFVEPAGQPRYCIQRLTWLLLAGVTFCLLMTTVEQFVTGSLRRILFYVAVGQFLIDSFVVLLVDDFRNVILNYAPVMLLFLLTNIVGLRRKTGSPTLIAAVLILAAASAVQTLNVDTFTPLDHNGLYHIITMLGALFLYRGSRHLHGAKTA